LLVLYVISGIIAAVAVYKLISSPEEKKSKHSYSPEYQRWDEILVRNLAIYSHMPLELKTKLYKTIKHIIQKTEFEGRHGLKVTEEIKVIIASQSALLIFNRINPYFLKLHKFVVYPSTFSRDGVKKHGESWKSGKVVISLKHAKIGGKNHADGKNLILHELAHQLDLEDGLDDGVPHHYGSTEYGSFKTSIMTHFASYRLGEDVNSPIDEYAATSHAEFFAVATETFFEKPQQLKKIHPKLYDELQKYYRVNPVEWF